MQRGSKNPGQEFEYPDIDQTVLGIGMGHEAPPETSKTNCRPIKTPNLVHTTSTTRHDDISRTDCGSNVDTITNTYGGVRTNQVLPQQEVHDVDAVLRSKYPDRIINTHTLQFETNYKLFKNNYATFSHTWVQEGTEVALERAMELLARAKWVPVTHGLDKREEGAGPNVVLGELSEELVGIPVKLITQAEAKLLRVIKAAKELGHTYVWVDNCCINQANNIELTEALSSMGEWYANASICLVHLEDYTGTAEEFHAEVVAGANNDSRDCAALMIEEHSCRWATRGWTLQEIVMSRRAAFYNFGWDKIFDTTEDVLQQKIRKNARSSQSPLSSRLSRLCRVPRELICYGRKPKIPAAVLMNMAAQRTTRRIEDGVYSLLGMLGVRMRADYGEGLRRAIERLLEQLILSGIADASIFNWTGQHRGNPLPGRSMYPVDLEGYDILGDFSREEFKVPGGMALSFDPPGIKARFDLFPIPFDCIVLERAQLPVTDRSDLSASKLTSQAHPESKLDTATIPTRFRLAFPDGVILEVSMSCPLEIFRAHMDPITSKDSQVRIVEWAFVKFFQAQRANWFLCAIPAPENQLRRGATWHPGVIPAPNLGIGEPHPETPKKRKVGPPTSHGDTPKPKNYVEFVVNARRMPTEAFYRVQEDGKTERLTSADLDEILSTRVQARVESKDGLGYTQTMVIG